MTTKTMAELAEMPIVTVEQVHRFRMCALERTKGLETDLGLMELELNHKATLLTSCELALAGRDKELEQLRGY